MDAEQVRTAYDTVAAAYAVHLPDTRAESPLDLAMIDTFATAVGTGPDERLLDAGCGPGRITRYLADRGARVEGVDLSPAMIDEARARHPDLRFAVAPLTDLPYPDGTFAGILLWYSIIHTPPERHPVIAAEVGRVLRPGGHLLVGFQSGHGTQDVAPAYRRRGLDVVLDRYLTTADDVVAVLADAGFAEGARLVRRPQDGERDDQAVVLLTRT